MADSVFREVAYQFDLDWTAGRLIGTSWIDQGYAADMVFEGDGAFSAADCAHLAEGLGDLARSIASAQNLGELALDVIVQPAEGRKKKLLVADMDSTMITVECIDELADYAGIKAEIAEVTERAMRGELDFAEALDARVALLEGLDAAAIDRCLAERVRLMPGARALVRTMRANGAYALLVSGGFTRFARPVAAEIGFDESRSNELLIAGGKLTGAVAKPIVDAGTKRASLLNTAAARGLAIADTLAVGDGANDIPMLEAAGLGVAYHAKPATAAAADARIEANDLTALLYVQGYARKDWVD